MASKERRKRGEGSWRWRGNVVEVAYRVKDPKTGKRVRVFEFRDSERAAKARLAEVTAKKEAGREHELLTYPFADAAREYLADCALRVRAGRLSAGQHRDIEAMLRNHILPSFGGEDVRLSDVHAGRIEKWVNAKLAGELPVPEDEEGHERAKRKLAPQTVVHGLGVISGVFDHAARNQRWFQANPTDAVRRPSLAGSKRPVVPMEQELCVMTLACTPRREQAQALTLLSTGLRIGECVGLGEDDVPDDGNVMHVRGALKRLRLPGEERSRLVFGKTKTDQGERYIPLGALLEVLREHKASLPPGRPDASGRVYLFRNEAGGPIEASNWRNRVWRPALGAAYLKLLDGADRRKVIAACPEELELVAELVALDTVHLRAALDARWDDYNGAARTLRYTDCDGDERSVKLSPELHERLMEHRLRLEAERPKPRPNKHGLIFLGPGRRSAGFRFEAASQAIFVRAFDAAGIDVDRRIHLTRHTWASAMIAGTPERPGLQDAKTLSRLIGHSRASFTRDVYQHEFERQKATLGDTSDLYRRRNGA